MSRGPFRVIRAPGGYVRAGGYQAPWNAPQRAVTQDRPVQAFDPSGQPDEVIGSYIRAMAHKFGVPLQEYLDLIQQPFGLMEIQAFPITTVSFGGMIAAANVPQLVIDQNIKRQWWMVANPDTAAETLYLLFKNNPNSPIPLQPGEKAESNPDQIIVDQIYVMATTPGHAYSAYEGTPVVV